MKRPATLLTVILGSSNYVVFAAWMLSLCLVFGVNMPSNGMGQALYFRDGSANLQICPDQPLTTPNWFAFEDPQLPQKIVGDFDIVVGASGDKSWQFEIPLPFILTLTVALSLLYGWGQAPVWGWFALLTVLGLELSFYVA